MGVFGFVAISIGMARLRASSASGSSLSQVSLVAYAVAALLLAWVGLGDAHAVEYLNRADAYAGCHADGSSAVAERTEDDRTFSYRCDLDTTQTEYQCWIRQDTPVFRDYIGCHNVPPYEMRHYWLFEFLPPIDAHKACGDECEAGGNPSNPVHTALGLKFQAEHDFQSEGGLDFSRHYSSLRKSSDLPGFSMGKNWTHSFEYSLETIENPPELEYQTIFAHRPTGERFWFKVSDDGSITQDPDVNFDLDRITNDIGAIIGWRISNNKAFSGEVETYDANGRIVSIVHPNGNMLDFEYDEHRLVAVRNRSDRSIFFIYGEGGLVQEVIGPSGQSYLYEYDALGNLTAVIFPDSTPGVSTDNPRKTYHYELSEQPLQHALTGISDENGLRHASWGYESLALWLANDYVPRATFSAKGAPSSAVGRVEFSYTGDWSDGYTQIVDANGQTTDYEFVTVFGLRKVASVSAPCAGCGQNSAETSYNAQGLIESTIDFKGVRSEYSYNTRNLITSRSEGEIAAEPDTCPANSTFYSGSYGSSCGGEGTCWNTEPFEGGIDATELGYSGWYYSCMVPSHAGSPAARVVETDWHPFRPMPAEERTYDRDHVLIAKSNWTYNDRGQSLTVTRTDPVTSAIRITSTTYCEQTDITAGTCALLGLVTSVNGPRTDATDLTTYTYRMADEATCAASPSTCPYRKGDLWKVTNALGHVTETLKYDGAGRVLSVKDPNGVITDFEYHPRGWLTARKVRGTNNATETDDQITRIEYWPTGLVKQVTQPGSFTAYAYDAAHRLTDIFDGDGNTIHYTLDNAGNRTQEDTKDAQGVLLRTLSRVYNQLGQLQTQKDAQQRPTGFTYDANGNLDTTTDALNRVADNDYDPLNRLQRTLQDVGGIEAETKFEYDALDNLTKVTDPKGLDTDYTYNAFGDLLTLSSPDTGTTTYTYDSAGNRKTQTDARNKTATYSYDALNRLTGVTYPTTALNVVYTYDTAQTPCISGETFSKGRLTRMQDSTGTTQYCYDRFGHLVRKVQVTNGKTLALRYAYTQAGQLSSVTYPDGAVVDYVRDGQGRATEVGVTAPGGSRQVLLREATYYPFGPVAEWAYGNGRLMQRSLNQNYQPGFIEDPFAGGISIGYEFNEVGNLAKLRTADQTDPPLRLFGYDDLNRLTEVKDSAQTLLQGYAYDATGNRESATLGGTFIDYTYPTGSHRLSAVGSTGRGYDDAGNTTQIGGTARQFLYNDAGRLRQVKTGNFVTMNYAYNGRGEQVVKYLGTAYTYAVYDEAGRWLGDYDSKGDAKQQAIWLDDLPVGLLVGSGTGQKLHYVEPDALGTPRVVIDPQRDVAVWKWELTGEAFGNSAPNQDPDSDGTAFVFDMRFPGQRYDAASGLSYNYTRDYEAATGRYSQSDSLGLKGGIATYQYADGNPTIKFDRYGLAASKSGCECPEIECKVVCNGAPIHPVVFCSRHSVDCKGTARIVDYGIFSWQWGQRGWSIIGVFDCEKFDELLNGHVPGQAGRSI